MAAWRLHVAEVSQDPVICLIWLYIFACDSFLVRSRFDPEKALQAIRGKRLMFVGDSLQRGQWQSFVCLVESVIPQGQKSMKRGRMQNVFKAKVHYFKTYRVGWTQTNSFDNSLGIQCFNRVLLGSISSWVEFRRSHNSGSEEENPESRFGCQACETLERSGHPCLQHICLVDEWS